MMKKAWVISVNMGYGHQRTAFPLRNLAFEGKIINANDYEGIRKEDKRIWESTRMGYEFISRFKRIPFIGNLVFAIFNLFQKISEFYPKRDLSEPNFALERMYVLFKEDGWGRDLIEKCKMQNAKLPIISTFFTPAFMAEFFNYPGEIFCVVCDVDIARSWAPLNPQKSKIRYFAPTERVVERLKLYGIKKENIFLTGYPLPKGIIGTENLEILKEDLKYRILNLDSNRKYFQKYKTLIETKLGRLPEKSNHPLTIMFSVGGAGVQREIGKKILQNLYPLIKENKIKIILSAGIKDWVRDYFLRWIRWFNLKDSLGKSIEIIFEKDIGDYFQKFNESLRKTDILWTKPSELSFYAALGIPIIVAPPIGSQEEFNMRYLLKSGFGIFQENPNYVKEWLFDWLNHGYLAESAMEGFIEGEKLGTFNIQKIISKCSGS